MTCYLTHRIRSGSFQVCKGRYRYEEAGDCTGCGCGGDGRASIWNVGWKCGAHHTQNEEAASLEGQQLMSTRFLSSTSVLSCPVCCACCWPFDNAHRLDIHRNVSRFDQVPETAMY